MSRSTGDRNSQQQQQPQQHSQNQQLIQPTHQQSQQLIRNPSTPQQQQQHQLLTLPPSGSFIIINNSSGLNANDAILRTPSNVVNTIQNSIYYSTTPSTAASAAVVNPSINATSITSQATPTSHLDPTSPIAKKRLKLDVTDSCGSSNTTEDLSALKKRILEHKYQRLKLLKEK